MRSNIRCLLVLVLLFSIVSVSACQEPADNSGTENGEHLSVSEHANGNFMNGNFLASNGEYIFFSDINRGGSLFQMDIQGNHYQCLDGSYEIQSIQCQGEHIRCFEKKSGVFKILKQDQLNTVKYSEESVPTFFAVPFHWIGDSLYFCSHIVIQKADPNLEYSENLYAIMPREIEEKIAIGQLNITAKYFYFLKGKGREYHIERCDIDGANPVVILNKPVAFFIVQGNWIYYLDQKTLHLWKVDVSGNRDQLVLDQPMSTFNIYNNWIYGCLQDNLEKDWLPVNRPYSYAERGSLFKVQTNGTAFQVLCEGLCGDIHVLGNRVFYTNWLQGEHYYYIEDNILEPTEFLPQFPCTKSPVLSEKSNGNGSMASAGNFNQGGSVARGGLLAFGEKHAYVALPFTGTHTDTVLLQLDTKEVKPVEEYVHCLHMTAANNGLYYILGVVNRSSVGTGNLFYVPTEPTEQKQEERVLDISVAYAIHDNWLYYSTSASGTQFFKEHLETRKRYCLHTDSARCINIMGQWIYYINQDRFLARMKLDGSNHQILLNDVCYDLTIAQDYMYYCTVSKELYRMNIQSGTIETVVKESVGMFNVIDNCVYYTLDDNLHTVFQLSPGLEPIKPIVFSDSDTILGIYGKENKAFVYVRNHDEEGVQNAISLYHVLYNKPDLFYVFEMQ